MKTIYATHNLKPLRIEITDEQLDLTQQAKNRVLDLVTENPSWQPALEIDVPIGYKLSCRAGNFVIMVTLDSMSRENIHNKTWKVFSDFESRSGIIADLGHYCYEGWESAINDRDLAELPDVWFEREFVRGFSNPSLDRSPDEWLNILLPEHQRLIIPRIYREARLHIEHIRGLSRELNRDPDKTEAREFNECMAIVRLCRAIWEGRSEFWELQAFCESALGEENEAESGDHGSLERD